MDRKRELQNKIKLTFPIIVLVFIFLLLIFNSINVKYQEKNSLSSLEKRVILATKVSKLLHETQKERGMSVGYLSNSVGDFQRALKLQVDKTDSRLKNLEKYIKVSDILAFEHLKRVLDLLKRLPTVRSSISHYSISVKEASIYYTNINNMLLEIVLAIAKTSHLDSVTNNSMAYVNLLFYEENLGLERAVGTTILVNNIVDQQIINLFNSYVVRQEIYKKLFLKYASEHIIELYNHHFKASQIDEVMRIRKIILNAKKDSISDVDPYHWFTNMTVTIDILKEIDSHLSTDMIENIQREYSKSKKSFTSYIILSFVMFFIFIMMIIMILRLQKNEKKLKNLLNTYVISSTTNLKGIITGVSKAFCNISGYSENELIGKSHNIVRHPDMPSELYKNMWQTIENGNIWQGEVKNLSKDGSYYWVTAVISPLYDNGKKIGYNSVRQDITDGKRIDELNQNLKDKISIEVAKSRQKDQQMIQQSRLAQMGEMISMIAHQWRQPLTAISATSAIIMLKAKSDSLEGPYVLERTRRISEYANHLSTTIDDFRDFFKPDKEKKETSFQELIDSVIGIVGVSLVQQNIVLESALKYNEKFTSYPNELKQVILNLIKNSEDVLIEKKVINPLIKLISFRKDNQIILEISDNGGGIDEDILDKIFDPYFSTKLKKDGTGLGLYMSKTIIEDHCQGKLRATNREGCAVFSIVLPI